MRLRHIEVFNAIMLSGSVTAAARLVNVSQPAISRTLKHAELQLGFPLFRRSGGRLQPTLEAQTLYPLVEQLFSQLDEVQRLATNLKAGRTREDLRVLTTLALSYDVMPRAMRLFHQRHPEVVVHHHASHSPQIVRSLALREADLGFVFGALAHPALEQELLGSRRVVCAAPKGMFRADELQAGEVSLEQLAGRPMIALDVRDPLAITLANVVRDAGLSLDVTMTVQNYHSALAMAQHGIGLALIESCSAAAADLDRVDVLPLVPTIPTTIHALRPVGNPGTRIGGLFVRCFREALDSINES